MANESVFGHLVVAGASAGGIPALLHLAQSRPAGPRRETYHRHRQHPP